MPSRRFSDIRWRRCAEDEFAWYDFRDGLVVYHRPSGKTHLVNEASQRLLIEILEKPKDLAAIAKAFEPHAAMASQGEYVESFAQMLLRLEQFGLIERV